VVSRDIFLSPSFAAPVKIMFFAMFSRFVKLWDAIGDFKIASIDSCYKSGYGFIKWTHQTYPFPALGLRSWKIKNRAVISLERGVIHFQLMKLSFFINYQRPNCSCRCEWMKSKSYESTYFTNDFLQLTQTHQQSIQAGMRVFILVTWLDTWVWQFLIENHKWFLIN